MSAVTGMLIPSGVGAEPQTITVSGIDDLQKYIGGVFDAVTKEVSDDVCIVGYVHDEGLLLDLEMNWIASALFMREIRGEVVLVNGFSADGVYDGENHDLPEAFIETMKTTFMEKVADAYNESLIAAAMLEFVTEKELVSEAEIEELLMQIDNAVAGDRQAMKDVNKIFNTIAEKADSIIGQEITDELVDDIYKFLDEQGK